MANVDAPRSEANYKSRTAPRPGPRVGVLAIEPQENGYAEAREGKRPACERCTELPLRQQLDDQNWSTRTTEKRYSYAHFYPLRCIKARRNFTAGEIFPWTPLWKLRPAVGAPWAAFPRLWVGLNVRSRHNGSLREENSRLLR